ncbi:BC1872 family protein [Paenibacillus peoriae]|uniref:BC1872 family protein n=1 Tax=Paenibacillus peoriae TaxID=59893 RepID=UPI00096D1560|nr:hypothetical protein [Paenibacillus peoriae]OMF50842.1 hypothetical protein BK135_00845 [Paenibacillus peoriae]
MTRDEVIAKWNSMSPRERDAWVAMDVMKYNIERKIGEFGPEFLVLKPHEAINWMTHSVQFSPTTDIAAAWEVIDKLSKTHFTETAMTQLDDGSWGWMARFILAEGEPCWMKGYRMTAATAQEAICLAALIATQGEGIEHEQ